MTDLQVTQPVFTLALLLEFRLRVIMLPSFGRWGLGHSRFARNTFRTIGGTVEGREAEQMNQMMQRTSSPGPRGRRVGPAPCQARY
jgi:hypothetical protein